MCVFFGNEEARPEHNRGQSVGSVRCVKERVIVAGGGAGGDTGLYPEPLSGHPPSTINEHRKRQCLLTPTFASTTAPPRQPFFLFLSLESQHAYIAILRFGFASQNAYIAILRCSVESQNAYIVILRFCFAFQNSSIAIFRFGL